MKFVSPLIVATLLFSFGLHIVQVEHTHYNETHGHGHSHEAAHADEGSTDMLMLGEQMHMSDKKVWFFVLGLMVCALSLLSPKWSFKQRIWYLRYRSIFYSRRDLPVKIYSHLQLSYATGLLNPKLF